MPAPMPKPKMIIEANITACVSATIVRNAATNMLYALNGNATAAGGTDALPGFVAVINGAEKIVLTHNAGQPLSAIDHRNCAEALDHEGCDHIAFRAEMRVLDVLFHDVLDGQRGKVLG